MDLSEITSLTGLNTSNSVSDLFNSSRTSSTDSTNTDSFAALFQSAADMISETDDLTNSAEEAEINYALGYSDNTHDLQIAQEKANIALQYTIAVRDRFLESYDSIMNMQI